MQCSAFLLVCIMGILGYEPRLHADEIIPINTVNSLVVWVEAHTNLMLLPRPKIFITDHAVLGLNAVSQGDQPEKIAAYKNGAIFIVQKYWHPDNIAAQSLLVHELTHYAQDLSQSRFDCPDQREEQAYRLQNEFLIEHGEKPYLDQASLDRLKACP